MSGHSWSPCHSPGSPSTSSMPPTPAYAGATALPEEGYGGYTHAEPPSDYTLHDKSMSTNLTPTQFEAYQDHSNAGFNGAAQYTDLNCAYSSMNLMNQPHQPQHNAPSNMDYSSFMASMPPYSL